MQSKDQVDEFFGKYIDKALKELHYEIGLLKDWFKKDFPEARLDVLVDINNVTRKLTITTRALMGEEVVANRGFFQNKLVITEKDFINPSFMKAFFKAFNYRYRQEIANSINAHYQQEKANSGQQV